MKSPLQAILDKCLECSCGSREEIILCPRQDCPLYLFRDKLIRRKIKIQESEKKE